MNNPDNMAPAEIVSEISDIHRDLRGKLDRIHSLSQTLYRRVKRAKPDDNTTIYLQYANAWIRFSGMANQGALRTVHASRVLKRLTTEAPAPAAKPKPKKEPETSPVESLMGLYSDEELEALDLQVQGSGGSDSSPVDGSDVSEDEDYDPSDEDNAFDSDDDEEG